MTSLPRRITPRRTACGRENASHSIGPSLPRLEIFGAIDESCWRNYSQTYSYDSGGNLTQLKHDAGAGNAYTRETRLSTFQRLTLLSRMGVLTFKLGSSL